MSYPKQHHILPRSYLSAFTSEGKKFGRLYVWDLKERKRFETSPQKAAREKHFYRIEEAQSEEEAMALEKFLSDIEGGFRLVRNRLQDKPTILITSKEFETIVSFVAMQNVRTRRPRDTLEDIGQDVGRFVLGQYTANPVRYEVLKKRASAAGIGELPPREEIQELVQSDAVPSGMTQNIQLSAMLVSFQTALVLMHHRLWSLVKAVNPKDRFIVSDNPVAFAWIGCQPMGLLSPGLGTPNSQLVFPMSPSITWVSIHEDEVEEGGSSSVIDADWRRVAQFNGVQIRWATRFVYSSAAEFDWMRDDGEILSSEVLFDQRS